MKIFGRDISFKKKKKPNASPQILGLADQIPNLKEGNLGPSLIKIKPVKNPTMHFFAKSWAGAAGRRTFQPPEYDFVEIGKIEDVEGYVRQSFIKKTGLMFKEGFVYKGANPKYVKYINRRFSQIAKASRIPHQELVRRIGHYLVKLNNAFLIKVRDEKASGGKVRTDARGRTIKPIAGYFPAAPETMEMLPNDAGEPVRWRQVLPDGTINGPWPAEDVIHFYWDRKEGFLFATPSIIPAIDDIRALRRLEQEIELLVHHHLFPLFQLIVGTENAPAGIGTDGVREIDAAQEMINEMPSEGIVVTSERIKIDAVGAEAKALRAEGYLEYFQKRVWASLGMSSVDFGNADCYDEETETLTENGWKYHWEIVQDREKIATFNPESQQIEFHFANYKYEAPYQGPMAVFKGKHVDIKVTPHHRMWARPKGCKWRIIRADTLIEQLKANPFTEWQLLETAPFLHDALPKPFNLYLPIDKINNRGRGNDKIVNIVDFAKFLGYFISEGFIDRHRAKENSYRIGLCQNEGECLQEMKEVLKRMDINFSSKNDPRPGREKTVRLTIYSKPLYNWLQPRVPHGARNKRLPIEVFSWPLEAQEILLESAIDRDGTRQYKNNKICSTYYTASKGLADDIQHLALSIGYSAKISYTKQASASWSTKGNGLGYIYRVLISGKKGKARTRILTHKMVKIEPYSGVIYCYNVPNHLYVTRRKGRVTIQGNTSNRSTSDTLSLALMDGVKYIQDVLEVQWNEWVISELLLESTFDPDEVLNEDNMVKLEFREIDLDKQVKMETHAMDLFTKQGLDHDELREALGRKPWVFPEPGESVDPNTHEKFLRSFFKLFEEPLALIKAGNEPFVNTQAQAQHPSIGLDEPLVTKGRSAEEKRLQLEAKAKAAARPKPVASAEKKDYILIDSLLSEPYQALEDELIQEFRTGRKMDNVWVKSKLMLTQNILAQKISAGVFPSFSQNFNRTDQEDFGLKLIQDTREIINFRANFYAKRLLDDLRSQIVRKGSEEQNVRAVFNALKYRLDFISDVETRKAANWAQMLNLYTNGYQQGKTVPIGSTACNVCLQRSESIIELSKMSYDAVLPHHSGCRCVFRGIK